MAVCKVLKAFEDYLTKLYLKRGLLGKVITKPYQRKMEAAKKKKTLKPPLEPHQMTIDDILNNGGS